MQDEAVNLTVETKEYCYQLNVIVGMGGLMAGIACLGTAHPSFCALLVVICATAFTKRMDAYYPKTVRAIRDLLKQHPDDEELKALPRLYERRIISFRSAGLSLVPYLVGTIFFTFVLMSEVIPFFFHDMAPLMNWVLGR